MWKSSLLTESVRERSGALWGVERGWGDVCVQLCKNTEQLLFVLTPEYNLPKMVAIMKTEIHDTEKKIDRDKIESI